MAELRVDDRDWRGGRVFSLVYSAGDDVHDLLERAATLYSAENALNTAVFPSLGRMQQDIVSITAGLLGADRLPPDERDGCGATSPRGAPSPCCRRPRPPATGAGPSAGVDRPNMVLATSAHAAFEKAAHYFDVESRRVPVRADFSADVDAMADAVDDRHRAGGGLGALLPAGGHRPDRRAGRAGLRPRHPLPRRRLPRRVPPPLPRSAWAMSPGRGTCRCPGSPRSPPTCTSTATPPRASRSSSTGDRRAGPVSSPSSPPTGWAGSTARPRWPAPARPGPIAAGWAVLHHLGRGRLPPPGRGRPAGGDRHHGRRRGHARAGPPGRPRRHRVRLRRATRTTGGSTPSPWATPWPSRGGWFFDRQTPPDSLHATVQAGHLAVVDELGADLAAAAARAPGHRGPGRGPEHHLRHDLTGGPAPPGRPPRRVQQAISPPARLPTVV